MATGGVNIRFSVQDEQVVREALDRLGKDGEAALKKLDSASKSPSGGLKALSSIVGELKDRAVGLAVPLGPLGSGLIAMGPAGLAAAAGIGAAVKVLAAMSEEADRLGRLSIQMRNLEEISGLTTDQIQGLNNKVVEFGGTGEQVAAIFGRFAGAVAELKLAGGPLYEQLTKINPQLVLQLSAAKNTAEAWNILAGAYKNASTEQQALIARTVGGRGNQSAAAGLLGSGNIDGLAGQMNALDKITKEQIDHWAKLKVEMDDALGNARTNLASVFTSDVLETERQFVGYFLDLTRAAKSLSSSDASGFFGAIASGLVAALPGISQLKTILDAAKNLRGGNQTSTSLANIDPFGKFGDFSSAAGPSPQVVAAQAAALVAGLGSAAGATERFNAQYKKLQADLDAGVFGAKGSAEANANFSRAVGGLRSDFAAQAINARVGSLGELATAEDLVKQRQEAITKAQIAGAGLSGAQIAAIINLTRANKEWSDMTAQAAVGVFNLATAGKAAGDVFQSWKDKGLIDPNNPQQMAAAMQVLNKELENTARTAQIAAAPLERLKGLELDAGSLRKQLDELGTTDAQAVGTFFVDMASGAKSASDAFKNLEASVVRSLLNMIANMLIVAPIARMLQSIFSFGGGAFFGGGGNWNAPGGPGTSRSKLDNVVNTARAAASGAGGGGASFATNLIVNVHEGAGGDKTRVSQVRLSGGDSMVDIFTRGVNDALGSGRTDQTLKSSFGAKRPTLVMG